MRNRSLVVIAPLAAIGTLTLALSIEPIRRAEAQASDFRTPLAASQNNREQASAWLNLFPHLLVDGDFAMAARCLRRAYALDSNSLTQTGTSELRRVLSTSPTTLRDAIVKNAQTHAFDSHFLLGAYLCLTGDRATGTAILRMHDIRVGGDDAAATIGGFKSSPVTPKSGRKLIEARHPTALAAAISEHLASPTGESLGLVISLMMSATELEGANNLLAIEAGPIPVWPSFGENPPWIGTGILQALLKASVEDSSKPVKPTPALVLGLTLLGYGETASAMATQATSASMSNHARLVWQSVLQAPPLPPNAVPGGTDIRLRDAGLLPSFAAAFDAIARQRPNDAATLLVRMPESDRTLPTFHLARGLALFIQGREDDALDGVTSWLNSFGPGMQLSPRLLPYLPPNLGASLSGPGFHNEAPVRTLLRFILANQAGIDTAAFIKSMALAGERHAALTEKMREIAGGTVPLGVASEVLADQAMKLGDSAFRSGDYALAKEHYLKAGQLDEKTPGLSRAILRAKFANQEWESAATSLLSILTTELAVKGPNATRESVADGFLSNIPGAYGRDADFKKHRENLNDFAQKKAVLESVWLMMGIVEFEAGNRDQARAAFRGVINVNGSLAPWARAFERRLR